MLGPLEISGAEVTAGRERTVLAMLLLRPGRLVPATDLVDALWDDDPPATAKAQLQTAVSRLRRRLPVGLILTDPAGYALHVARHDLDALQFADLMAQARALAATDGERAAVLMRAALGLWRGPALAGVESRLVRQRAAALDEEHGAAVEEWADLEIALGHDRAVLGELTAMVERFPLRERLRGQLMTALNNAGRQADALAEYRRARALLIEELGIEPGEELRRLHERILSGESTAAVAEATKPARVPRELPPEPRSFTARVHELSTLDGLLGDEVLTTVVISAMSGTAGIGKTTLALHWGHRVAGHFPDGQLYVNLRGYDAGDAATRPDEALREFLHALEVPERRIPARLDAQSALFRSILAGRRMLVVLDNARDAEQVRPLLPASPGCMAVVTSRAQLTGLIATAGAHLITLGLLSLDEARQMLAGRLGEHRLAAEPEAVDRIIGACGHLPLALAIAAARSLARPDRPLEKLAGELDEARLDALATGDPSADARAVFSWSYRALSPRAATLFRRAGLYPGPDFGLLALAALLGATPAETSAALDELVGAHLVAVRREGRWDLHDLLREYARELAETEDPIDTRRDALDRLCGWFIATGRPAAGIRFPQRMTFGPVPAPAGVAVAPPADEASVDAWFADERESLLAAIPQAAAAGLDRQAWQLTDVTSGFLVRNAYRRDYAAITAIGLPAAERHGDVLGRALMEGNRGISLGYTGDLPTARSHMERASELFASIGHDLGVGNAELELGTMYSRTDEVDAAVRHATRALLAFIAAGNEPGQGKALNNLGWYRYRKGDAPGAVEYARRAIEVHRRHGYHRGLADALDTLGVAYRAMGDLPRAIAALADALEESRLIGDRVSAADCLVSLGDTYAMTGDAAAARSSYAEAVAIYAELDDPEAEVARRKLDQVVPG